MPFFEFNAAFRFTHFSGWFILYFSILTTNFDISAEALIHLELIELPDSLDEDKKTSYIVDIARCRNNNMRLKQQSQADFQGYYDRFKEFMSDDSKIVWHEGDSNACQEAINSEHLIRILAAMDPKWFYHPIYNKNKKSHKRAATSIGSIHREWFDGMEDDISFSKNEKPLRHMAVLIERILKLRDMLSYSLQNDRDIGNFRRSSLWQNYLKPRGTRRLLMDPGKEGCNIPATFEVLLSGLFRSDVWLGIELDGSSIKYIGWYIDPKKLWNMRKKKVLDRLNRAFKDFNQEPLTFIRAQTVYENDLYQIGTGAQPPLPNIVYNTESGQKYVFDTISPTHFLDTDGPIELKKIKHEVPQDVKTCTVK